jgi:WhiB family redox-sensing transcriptional regulator
VSAVVAGVGLGLCPGCGRRMVAEGRPDTEVALHAGRGLCTRCVKAPAARRELWALASAYLRPATAEWLPLAACAPADVDPALFHPESWESPSRAREVCGRCPVRRECLADALETKERFGIRGGLTPEERSAWLRGDR